MQNTRTSRTLERPYLPTPLRASPRSKALPAETENALCKIGSALPKVTDAPQGRSSRGSEFLLVGRHGEGAIGADALHRHRSRQITTAFLISALLSTIFPPLASRSTEPLISRASRRGAETTAHTPKARQSVDANRENTLRDRMGTVRNGNTAMRWNPQSGRPWRLARHDKIQCMTGLELEGTITRYLTQPESDRFDDLALEAFRFQYQSIAPYRALCDRRGIDPAALTDWRQIPLVPTSAFKTLELASRPAIETFRSSGTGGDRSVHHHGFPDLYRAVIDASFPEACLPSSGERVSVLSLVPGRDVLPDSSLSFMIDHVLAKYGSPASATALGARGVELGKARSWLNAAQRGGRPVLLVATAFALLDLLDTLTRIDLHFRLPAGTLLFETGGFKGKTREISRQDLLALTENRLGIPASAVVREYGMTELTSQCYTRSRADGDPDLFTAPHWVRVRALDAATLEAAALGETGLLAILDLANLSSAVHLLTEDLGTIEGSETGEANTFRLRGRASGAELRGCSLAAEELTQGR